MDPWLKAVRKKAKKKKKNESLRNVLKIYSKGSRLLKI